MSRIAAISEKTDFIPREVRGLDSGAADKLWVRMTEFMIRSIRCADQVIG